MHIDISGEQTFRLEGNNPLDGIISYLTGKYGGNVHDRSAVGVSCSSCFSDRHAARNAVELDDDSIFNSKGLPNQWIAFDFKSRMVVPTHYTFRSGSWKGNNPSSWVLEGSNDGDRWEELDRQVGNDDLVQKGVVRTYEVNSPQKCRHLRIRQIGKNHNGFDTLVLSGLEVFGILSSWRAS
jgi:hypothetical protein